MIEKIISGGQTGADQAGLYVAKQFGITTGGWAPKEFMTRVGPNLALLRDEFGLQEHDGGYRERTIQNIKDSDGTIILSFNWNSRGTALTLNQCIKLEKPFKKVYLDAQIIDYTDICDWISTEGIHTLNVAGNSESNPPKIFDAVVFQLNTILNLYSITHNEPSTDTVKRI
ncbi:MAG TPA: hypothetical protein ENI23_17325 [bacterium]|nr:hypothetical protein [bacterium]